MKKLVALGLSALVACVPALGTGAQAGPAKAGPVEIQMFVNHDPSWQAPNLDTAWTTKYLEQKFNIKIDWIDVAPADADSKQQLLLESGDYPPVFYNGSFSPAQLAKYAQEGILVSLNKYLPEYAPNVVKALKEFVGAAPAVTSPDGNIWGIPNLNYCLHCDFSSKFWINTKWLAKVHMSMPRTTADFLKVLLAFKTIPGVKDPIPLSGAVDSWNSDPMNFLMNAFIYDPSQVVPGGAAGSVTPPVYYQNGKLVYAPIQPQWQQGLAYIKSLADAGVVDSTAFSQPVASLKTEAAQGRLGVVALGVDNGFINYQVPGNKSSDWVVVPPLTGPSGANFAAFFGQGPTAIPFVITNKATPAQIKAILTMVNWLFTPDGTMYMDFGPQGPNTWTYAKPGQQGLCSKQALYNINWNVSNTLNLGWNQLGPFYQSEAWRCGGPYTPVFSATSEEEKYQSMTSSYYEGHQPPYVYPAAVWVPQSQSTQFATLTTTVNQYFLQWSFDFILGRKNIFSDWKTYTSGLQGLGLANYLQMLQSVGKPLSTAAFCPSTPMTLPCHQ